MIKGVIIAARATYDRGKTTAIRSIWFYLKKNSAAVVSEKFNSQGPGKPEDVQAILEYAGVRIGISSMGDPGINQTGILDEFAKNGCRIIICACRIWGGTKEPIDALANDWDIRYIHPANHGYISADAIWNELMTAIRLIKLVDRD